MGDLCQRQARAPKRGALPVAPKPPHPITTPEDDEEFQLVSTWLMGHPDLDALLRDAVTDAIEHILDGGRTSRFDIWDDTEVDSDERSAIGTQVQYRVLERLDLPKIKPLDTVICGVAVDIKNTVNRDWQIPKEGQCELCLLIQIDAKKDRYRAFLMRTHEILLRPGKNQDSKRSIIAEAFREYARPLFDDWIPLPRNPLRDLTPDQVKIVFDPTKGQRVRLTALFGFLPNTIITRRVIQTVCARNNDPMRRVRQAKPDVLAQHHLELLCGIWAADKAKAASAGFTLAREDWVAIPADPAGLGTVSCN